mgnify:CR=1 FL=1
MDQEATEKEMEIAEIFAVIRIAVVMGMFVALVKWITDSEG